MHFFQKYERIRGFVKIETESRAFATLSKEHMSSDDDEAEGERLTWEMGVKTSNVQEHYTHTFPQQVGY